MLGHNDGASKIRTRLEMVKISRNHSTCQLCNSSRESADSKRLERLTYVLPYKLSIHP
jgi:hypothetical protein